MKRTISTLALAVLAAPALAQVPDNVVELEVLPGWRDAAGVHQAGLRLSLAPGWKTYWRAPGDAGIPPLFDWTGSDNVTASRVSWPVPSVFLQNGLRSVGYETEVILPIAFRAGDASRPIALQGTIDLGVCEDICVPIQLEVSATLPATGGSASPALKAAMADRPMTEAQAGVAGVSCSFEQLRDGLRVSARIDMPALGRDEVAIMEVADPTMWVAEPEVTRAGTSLAVAADVVPAEAQPFFLARSDVRVTVLAGGRAVDIQGCD